MQKKYILFTIIVLVLASGMMTCNKNVSSIEQDLHRINEEEYEAFFCSMYDVSNYSEDYFSLQNDKKTIILETTVKDFEDFLYYVEKIKVENPTIRSVYFGINPIKLWSDEGFFIQENALAFNSLFFNNKDIKFELFLPYPSIDYWERMTQEQMNAELDMYERIVQMCENYTNVTIHYMCAEDWLVFNLDNYEQNEFLVKINVANKLANDIAAGKYVATVDSVKAQNSYLEKQVEEKYFAYGLEVDLSEWNIVFLGDSIIGLEHSNTSIPNLVRRLTAANTYNMGIGGASASKNDNGTAVFYEMAELEKLNSVDKISENKDFFAEVKRFMEGYKNKYKLCFVINFGINDYINGSMIENEENKYDVETYKGALRVAIEKLQKDFPNAEFIIMTPTYINSFLEGKEQNDISGCILQEYREAVKAIAEEYDIYCKDNYEDLNIDETNYWKYCLDDMHLNGNGRFIFAESLVDYFKTNILM